LQIRALVPGWPNINELYILTSANNFNLPAGRQVSSGTGGRNSNSTPSLSPGTLCVIRGRH
jgi:hypothetical protein